MFQNPLQNVDYISDLFFEAGKNKKVRLHAPHDILSFSPSIHWVLLRLQSRTFSHSEPVLFFSLPLLFSSLAPSLLTWVAVMGHGGAVADFCMRGLSSFYSDSKKRIRTSYQSKSRLHWRAGAGNAAARRQSRYNWMSFVKHAFVFVRFKNLHRFITLESVQNKLLILWVICYQIQHSIKWIWMHTNTKTSCFNIWLSLCWELLLVCAEGLCNDDDHMFSSSMKLLKNDKLVSLWRKSQYQVT